MVHWRPTPFRVNNDQDISQLDAEYYPELGQSDPIIVKTAERITKFRVTLVLELSIWPQWTFFRVTLTRPLR